MPRLYTIRPETPVDFQAIDALQFEVFEQEDDIPALGGPQRGSRKRRFRSPSSPDMTKL